jgi:hypothetical protein
MGFSYRCNDGIYQIFGKQHKPRKAGRYEVVLTVFANLTLFIALKQRSKNELQNQ